MVAQKAISYLLYFLPFLFFPPSTQMTFNHFPFQHIITSTGVLGITVLSKIQVRLALRTPYMR